ncbi:hypothetical protein F4819DRAFT_440851 [Hypoxylon fuscum]|nr:hypothetical protein F4819DRAFT_440851 [Hypoxylon fuscum]
MTTALPLLLPTYATLIMDFGSSENEATLVLLLSESYLALFHCRRLMAGSSFSANLDCAEINFLNDALVSPRCYVTFSIRQ